MHPFAMTLLESCEETRSKGSSKPFAETFNLPMFCLSFYPGRDGPTTVMLWQRSLQVLGIGRRGMSKQGR